MRGRGQFERHLTTVGCKLRRLLMGGALVVASCHAGIDETEDAEANQQPPPVTDTDPVSTGQTSSSARSANASAETAATDAVDLRLDSEPPSDDHANQDAESTGATVDEEEREAFPQVTFPEATIRDPEAEAADRERRQSVIGLFERLRIEAEHRTGYDREAVFDGWLYSGGQSTRDRVLASEQLPNGSWFSAYDSVVVLAAADLDVDHIVPLAEAWESGGHTWSADTWTRFGNDLDDPRSLIAVSAATNRSKGAKDPQDWWPPEPGYRCQYAADWIAVKARWSLTMDAAEQRSLDTQLESCSGAEFVFSTPVAASVTLTQSSTALEDETSATAEPDAAQKATEEPAGDCHPAYEPCLPNLPGDALNCGDLAPEQKPVRVKEIGVDPYRLDRNRNGLGCTS